MQLRKGFHISAPFVKLKFSLHETACIPMLAYSGDERAKSMAKSDVRRHFNALHWMKLLTLTLAFTFFLEVVAGRMHSDLVIGL